MDSAMKQRLVGALILLALAVLFWPIIFVPQSRQGSDLSVVVPAVPPVDLSPLPEPDNAGIRMGRSADAQRLEAESAAAGAALVDGAAAEAPPLDVVPGPETEPVQRDDVLPVPELDEARETLVSPPLDADGLPIAFSLQVATMGNPERANALRDELIAAGYKAYVKRLRRNDRSLYRVLVGPRFSRDELDALKVAVDESWRVDSLIIRYIP